jgi:hypothetical protein
VCVAGAGKKRAEWDVKGRLAGPRGWNVGPAASERDAVFAY